jgi:hypothetical protein
VAQKYVGSLFEAENDVVVGSVASAARMPSSHA